jgi:hypothetical protein
MTMLQLTASASASPPDAEYRAGLCNIGPAEIARRRRAGHVGVLATLLLFAGLAVIDAPPIARLLLVIPAAVAASGYLQAWLRFCAAFGSTGVFNFGQVGDMDRVTGAEDRARDRLRSRQIAAATFGIGLVVGIVAVLLPL